MRFSSPGFISRSSESYLAKDPSPKDLALIKQYYGDRGYIRATVVPDPQLDRSTQRVNLTYRVTEHDVVAVNRIKIEGNLRTKDVVIRRELRIYPGEQFDGTVKINARTQTAIALAAIDNLGRGAAGQAIHNMNLMFGLPETTGLKFPGLFP